MKTANMNKLLDCAKQLRIVSEQMFEILQEEISLKDQSLDDHYKILKASDAAESLKEGDAIGRALKHQAEVINMVMDAMTKPKS